MSDVLSSKEQLRARLLRAACFFSGNSDPADIAGLLREAATALAVETNAPLPPDEAWLRWYMGYTFVPEPAAQRALQSYKDFVHATSRRETFEDLQAQCQALWRTDVTLVCRLPKGHAGDHRADNRWTFNGECVVGQSPEKTEPPLQGSQPCVCLRTCAAAVGAGMDELVHCRRVQNP